ncbi:MAG TPA: HAMP domain-containing sensor histidine kinase, partial [Candidatus Eisenbacteria bacterium]|nr:HAMP domain-containing sensor histidine kinase [Candidatus Eisenbacteria bacterium]
HRPPWWPEGEPWPPTEWRGPPWWWGGRMGAGPPYRRRHGRGGLARRFGCFLLLLALLAVWTVGLAVWLIATLLGWSGDEGFAHPIRLGVLVVLIVGLAAFSYGIRLVRGIGRPLGELVDAAGRIEAGDYAVRVPDDQRGPSELRHLSRAFNTMTARLESDDARRRRLLADVGHELRTPLAVIQGHLEAMLDGVYPADEAHLRPILDETRVMARLIDDLRTVSLAEAGALPLHREPTDVAIVVAEVARSFQPRGEAAGVQVVADTPDDLPLVDLDPIRVREVVANLVDNAIRYAGTGGTVRITVTEDGRSIAVEVADTGPGIAAELLPSVFDRFAKSAESRGSGLGLAIAKAIVEAHGGRISADSPPAGGTRIRFEIPIG